MKRWHEERDLMLGRMTLERHKHGVAPDVRDGAICHCLLGIGFVRKRRPYGCSNPRCALCHYEKFNLPKARAAQRRDAIEFDLRAA
jgi:hypothetical protein